MRALTAARYHGPGVHFAQNGTVAIDMAKSSGATVESCFPIRGWFADCTPRFRREFLALGRPKFYAAGSVIYQADDVGQDVFGISSGVVTLQSKFTHPDAVLLHMLRPGEWFGTVPVLLERSRRVTAVARTDVDLLRVPGDELRALLRRRPEWSVELGRDAIYSMDLAMQIAADLLIRDASARCAAVLLRLAGRRWASATGCRPAVRDSGFANRARDALQRLQEYVQPRGARVLEPSTRDPRLQVADRERPCATA